MIGEGVPQGGLEGWSEGEPRAQSDFWPLNPIGPLGCTIPSLGVRVVLGVLRASRG